MVIKLQYEKVVATKVLILKNYACGRTFSVVRPVVYYFYTAEFDASCNLLRLASITVFTNVKGKLLGKM